MKTIKELQKQAFEDAKAAGWHDKPISFPEMCALLHSEVSEALEFFREHDKDSWSATEPVYRSAVTGNLTRARTEFVWELGVGEVEVRNKPEGVGSEFADVLIRLVHYCELLGIDLEKVVEEKMSYNRTRPYRHGGKAC